VRRSAPGEMGSSLRLMKLMGGGRSARREAKLMVSEKMDAAFKAIAGLMVGASDGRAITPDFSSSSR
jgi:hypothetical protein